MDEAIIPLQTETSSLRSISEQQHATLSAIKMDAVESRHESEGVERDMRHRFDNVSRVFKVFAEALHVQTPSVVDNKFKE